MRKLFWCCTAAGVVAVGAVGAVGRHAFCPEAAVSGGATAATATLRLLHPLSALGLALGQYARGPAQETIAQVAPAEEVPDEPVAAQTPEPEVLGPPPITIPEEEPAVVGGVVQGGELCEPPAHEGHEVGAYVTGTLCPAATVESNGQAPAADCRTADQPSACPMVMPYCTDEEASADVVPTMPHADDEPAADARAVFSFWTVFFEGLKEGKEGQQAAGQSGDGGAPSCQEDEHYYEHYSGCPYTGYHLPSQRCPVTPIAEPAGRPGEDECSEPASPKKHKVNYPGRGAQGDGCPAHPDVDTMEYRRSDGGLNEYGPGPF